MNYFKNTLSNIIVYYTMIVSLQTIMNHLVYSSKYTLILEVFPKFQVKNTPISRLRGIGFKIPLFLWNLEHTFDHKCSWRVATKHGNFFLLHNHYYTKTIACPSLFLLVKSDSFSKTFLQNWPLCATKLGIYNFWNFLLHPNEIISYYTPYLKQEVRVLK